MTARVQTQTQNRKAFRHREHGRMVAKHTNTYRRIIVQVRKKKTCRQHHEQTDTTDETDTVIINNLKPYVVVGDRTRVHNKETSS